jgi:hypothetical protein
MNELEIELHRIMVQLVVRYPDGMERIQFALQSVFEAGLELDSAYSIKQVNLH